MKRVLAWIVELVLFQVFYYLQHYLWVLVHLGFTALKSLSTTLYIVLLISLGIVVLCIFAILAAVAAALIIWLCQRIHRSPIGKRYRVLSTIYIVYYALVAVLAIVGVAAFNTPLIGFAEVLTMIYFCGILIRMSKNSKIYQ